MAPIPESIYARLVADHDELDALLDRLIRAFESGDREVASEAFREADAMLTEHFVIEESVLFPEFAKFAPIEAEALRAEHAAMRARIDELGVGVELHETHLPAIRQLAQDLRRHAAREHTMLYRWAAGMLAPPLREQRAGVAS